MATLTLKLPRINTALVSASALQEAKNGMWAGYMRHKDDIDLAARLTNVPISILLPFIFIETGGKMESVRNKHSSATGPMQLMPGSGVDIICTMKSKINDEFRAILVKHLGEKRVAGYLKKGSDGGAAIRKYGNITRNELDNYELCCLLGGLMLSYLITRNVDKSGVLQMERICIKYGQGISTSIAASTPVAVVAEVRLRFGKDWAEYVIKMTGKNGYLSAFA